MTLVAFLLLIVPALFFGRALLRLKMFPTLSSGESIIFSLVLGLGVISLGTFGLGVGGFLYPKAVITMLISLLAIGLMFGRKLLSEAGSVFRYKLFKFDNIFTLSAMVVFFALLLISLPSQFLPVTEWDSQAHHLEIPKLYLERGRMFEIPEIFHSYGCLNFEMINAVLMAIGSDIAPQLLQWSMAVATGGCLILFGSLLGNTGIGWAAAALYFAQPVTLKWMHSAKGDLGLAFFATCGLYAMWRSLDGQSASGKLRWMSLAGISCGFAAGAKTTGLGVAVVAAVIIAGYGLLVNKKRSMFISAGVLVVVSILVASPWYIKSVLWTQDPMYPHLGNLLSDGEVKLHKTYGEGLLDYVLLPWSLTFSKNPYGSSQAAPYFLAFLPGLLIFRRIPGWIIAGSCFAFIYVSLFYLLTIHIRYILPSLVTLCLIIAWTLNYCHILSKKEFMGKVLCFAAMFCVMLPIYSQLRTSIPHSIAYALGETSRDEYLIELVEPYKMYEYIGTHLPENAKIIASYEVRGYYCPRKLYSLNHSRSIQQYWSKQHEEDIQLVKTSLIEKGIEYLLVNGWYVNTIKRLKAEGVVPYSDEPPILLRKEFIEGLRLIKEIGTISLYKIEE